MTEAKLDEFHQTIAQLKDAVAKVVVGQERVVE